MTWAKPPKNVGKFCRDIGIGVHLRSNIVSLIMPAHLQVAVDFTETNSTGTEKEKEKEKETLPSPQVCACIRVIRPARLAAPSTRLAAAQPRVRARAAAAGGLAAAARAVAGAA
jgi:hypothetical protein